MHLTFPREKVGGGGLPALGPRSWEVRVWCPTWLFDETGHVRFPFLLGSRVWLVAAPPPCPRVRVPCCCERSLSPPGRTGAEDWGRGRKGYLWELQRLPQENGQRRQEPVALKPARLGNQGGSSPNLCRCNLSPSLLVISGCLGSELCHCRKCMHTRAEY